MTISHLDQGKIRPEHRERAAYVYVRQSSPMQVREHQESRRRQYAFAEQARALGWSAPQVVTVDEDQGRSGALPQTRPGFGRLVTAVARGEVGIVLSLELARLSRNDPDWHHLVHLCRWTGTLIADEHGLYDPTAGTDRMVLGIRGQVSELERDHAVHRMVEARWNKARRGEMVTVVPAGYEVDETGQMGLTSDEAVAEAIRRVFAKFDELGSARQVFVWWQQEGLPFPVRPGGAGASPRRLDPGPLPGHPRDAAPSHLRGRVRVRAERDAPGARPGGPPPHPRPARPAPARSVARVDPGAPPGVHLVQPVPAEPGTLDRQRGDEPATRRRAPGRRPGGAGAAAGARALRAVRAPHDRGLRRRLRPAHLAVSLSPARRVRPPGVPAGGRQAGRGGRRRDVSRRERDGGRRGGGAPKSPPPKRRGGCRSSRRSTRRSGPSGSTGPSSQSIGSWRGSWNGAGISGSTRWTRCGRRRPPPSSRGGR